MRPELSKENADKVYKMVNKIRDEHGIDMTPNSLVNLIIKTTGIIEYSEFIGLIHNPPSNEDDKKQKPKRVKTKKSTNWVMKI